MSCLCFFWGGVSHTNNAEMRTEPPMIKRCKSPLQWAPHPSSSTSSSHRRIYEQQVSSSSSSLPPPSAVYLSHLLPFISSSIFDSSALTHPFSSNSCPPSPSTSLSAASAPSSPLSCQQVWSDWHSEAVAPPHLHLPLPLPPVTCDSTTLDLLPSTTCTSEPSGEELWCAAEVTRLTLSGGIKT